MVSIAPSISASFMRVTWIGIVRGSVVLRCFEALRVTAAVDTKINAPVSKLANFDNQP